MIILKLKTEKKSSTEADKNFSDFYYKTVISLIASTILHQLNTRTMSRELVTENEKNLKEWGTSFHICWKYRNCYKVVSEYKSHIWTKFEGVVIFHSSHIPIRVCMCL